MRWRRDDLNWAIIIITTTTKTTTKKCENVL